jgi:hypothetical protein
MIIGGREGLVVSRRFCDFLRCAVGVSKLEGDEGGVGLDWKVKEESREGRVAGGLEV